MILRAVLALLMAVQPASASAAVLSVPARAGVPSAAPGAAGAAVPGPSLTGTSAAILTQAGLPGLSALPTLATPMPQAGVSRAPAVAPTKTAARPAAAPSRAPLAAIFRAFRRKGTGPGERDRSRVPDAARAGERHPIAPAARRGSALDAALEPVAGNLKFGTGMDPLVLKGHADADWTKRLGESDRPLNILMTGSESYPYVKTGGLADVIDDVSRGLAAQGHHVTVVVPKYSSVSEDRWGLELLPGAFGVPVAGRMETARLWRAERDGVEVLFVESEEFFGRLGPYGHRGHDYIDNDERFIFHARAALEAVRFLERSVDVVHVHDWQAGLIPAYLKLVYDKDPLFAGVRSVMTVHNIAYQGFFPKETLVKAGFSWDRFNMHELEYYDHISFLKAGIVFADAITTVSPNYAEQLKTPEFGHGLDGLLSYRAEDLVGILNGVDPESYDPRSDTVIERHYGAQNVRDGKRANKKALQKKAGLDIDPDKPVFGVAARLADQKGIDVITEIMGKIVEMGAQLFVIGSGDPELEKIIDDWASKYPRSIHRHPFDTKYVRMVYAASDFLLMPSRFEPCGLSQMFAHLYGTLPIATRTGGLADTIIDLLEHPERGDGFFLPELSAEALADTVARAVALFRDKDALMAARRRAMAADHTWKASLDRYAALYRRILARQD